MAYTTVNKSTDHFNPKNYSGNGSTNNITGVGFQPDWVWIKQTNGTGNHHLYDVVRGATKYLESSSSAPEQTQAAGLTAFGTDGFTLGSNGSVNSGSGGYNSWCWKAGNSSGSANNDGATASTVSVNSTAGFSIVKWTGTSGNTTVGHGLGTAPAFTIAKNLITNGNNWVVYHKSISPDYATKLNLSDAQSNSNNYWQSTAPTNSLLTFTGNTASNSNGNNMIAYCFAEKPGYCKVGRYDGNGSSNGNFIYLGFKPTYFLVKRYDTSGAWIIKDGLNSGAIVSAANTPDGRNPNETEYPKANQTNVNNKASAFGMDFVSNGIKIRGDNGEINTNGGDYIYLALGQTLVGSNNIPCTAR